MKQQILRFLLLALFFLSGASALVFETLWQRVMTLTFGASAIATTAILTAFFIGIGFGAYLGGKVLTRFRSALNFYWALELGIAVFGLAVPLLLQVADLFYAAVAPHFGVESFIGFGIRFGLAILAALPATLCMGATIPTMNRLLAEQRRDIGASVAVAFGVNTIGAVLGCLATGVVLVPLMGIFRSFWAAASVNMGIAAIVFLLSRLAIFRAETDQETAFTRPPQDAETVYHPRWLAAAYFASGALALGYEVVWMRIMSIYSTTSWLTFSIVLAVYLAGFGLGSLVLFPVLARRLSGRTIFVVSNFGAGIFGLLLTPLAYWFPEITDRFIFSSIDADLTLWQVANVEFFQSFGLVFLPTVFLGLAYPAVCRSLTSRIGQTARVSGRLYFLGNLGSAVGVLVVGLLSVPVFGLIATLCQLWSISIGIGVAVMIGERLLPPGKKKLALAGVAAAACGLIAFQFAAKPFVNFTGDDPISLVRYNEGATGTVVVFEDSTSARAISIDGKSVSGTSPSGLIDAKMLAHIPLILHANPRNALTVGFGIGATSWSLTRYPIEADCVEIEREVIRSAPLFRDQNFGVLQHPRFRVILNDARDYLRTTGARYDVISTDVTTFRYKQNADLYSLEYFKLMKARLAPDGVACAWVPMSGISEREFKILLRTFGAAFPHSSLWFMNHNFTQFAILIGTPGPLQIDMQRVVTAFSTPEIADDLRYVGVIDPLQFIHFVHLDNAGYREFAGGGSFIQMTIRFWRFPRQRPSTGSSRCLYAISRRSCPTGPQVTLTCWQGRNPVSPRIWISTQLPRGESRKPHWLTARRNLQLT